MADILKFKGGSLANNYINITVRLDKLHKEMQQLLELRPRTLEDGGLLNLFKGAAGYNHFALMYARDCLRLLGVEKPYSASYTPGGSYNNEKPVTTYEGVVDVWSYGDKLLDIVVSWRGELLSLFEATLANQELDPDYSAGLELFTTISEVNQYIFADQNLAVQIDLAKKTLGLVYGVLVRQASY